MKRVLVTGSSGFLGRHLCRLLTDLGMEPIGLDIAPALEGVEEIEGSVADARLWERLPSVDGIVHGAALTDLWRRDVKDFDRVNREGSRHAANFAARQGAAFVYVSSYTTLMPRMIRQETRLTGAEKTNPESLCGPYPASKRRAELAVTAALPEAAVVLPTAPIGPGDHRLTPPMRLMRDLAAGDLPGVMRGRINIVDIRDVAAASVTALEEGAGGRFLLSGHDLGLKAFAEKVAAVAGAKAPGLEVPGWVGKTVARAEDIAGIVAGRAPKAPLAGVQLATLPVTFDPMSARDALGFEPRPLDRSIADAVDFLRQEGFLAP